ncbi:hypothetical protein ACVMHW_000208 [Bradyrhizobium diazoefficiens]
MDQLKRQAAARALEEVRDGMQLGLGTGSTAKHFVELLGERVAAGLKVIGVPTSEATRLDATRCGVPLTTLDEIDHLDITVDGADEIDPELNLIKGGGGALLREKIVAAASDRMIVIADDTKWVPTLGRFPLPIEVIPFGARGDAPGDRDGICAVRRFRANGGPQGQGWGQGWPRFRHRWRPLDPRCPARTDRGSAQPRQGVERHPRRGRAWVVHRLGQLGCSGGWRGNSRD